MKTPEEMAAAWKAAGRRLTPTDDAVIIGMSKFYSLRQIADHLGRSISTIQSACRRLGVRTSGGTGGQPMHKPQESAE